MPQVSAAGLRSKPSSTSASASIRRAAALSFSPLAALRSSEAVRSSRVIDTAAPIDAAPLKSQHRVRVSLIWESLMSHSFGPLVSVLVRGDRLHQGHQLTLHRLVLDLAVGAQQPEAEGAVEEEEAFDFARLAVAVVVEERDGHVERGGDQLKTSSADAVHALL